MEETKTQNPLVPPETETGYLGEGDLNQQVIDALCQIFDPEIPVNIWELGLIYKVDIDEAKNVKISMTLTSPACPVAGTLPPEVEQRVKGVPGIGEVTVEVVWEPPWDKDMMSEASKLQLGFL